MSDVLGDKKMQLQVHALPKLFIGCRFYLRVEFTGLSSALCCCVCQCMDGMTGMNHACCQSVIHALNASTTRQLSGGVVLTQ